MWSIFTPLYVIGFGVMLASFEYKPEFIYEWFQFLGSFIGRGIFYIL
jgi:hypothetical protein